MRFLLVTETVIKRNLDTHTFAIGFYGSLHKSELVRACYSSTDSREIFDTSSKVFYD